jgi:hypothetical protein|tara:strand:+ start:348 stop:587 length:240 start_codon:yes stop_codon:yes gene_type:complete
LILVDDDCQMLHTDGNKIPGLLAAGDILWGELNLIATSFDLGQDSGSPLPALCGSSIEILPRKARKGESCGCHNDGRIP